MRAFLLAIYMAHLSFFCISSTFTGTFLLLVESITFASEVSESSGPSPLGCSLTPLTHRVDGFPVLRLLRPFRHSSFIWVTDWGIDLSERRLPPLLLPIGLGIPGGASRVRQEGLKRNAVGGVFLAAPSALCGSPV